MTPAALLQTRADAGEELTPEERDVLHLDIVFKILDYSMPVPTPEDDPLAFRRALAYGTKRGQL